MAEYSVVIAVSFTDFEMVAAEQARLPGDMPWEVVFGHVMHLHHIVCDFVPNDGGDPRLIFFIQLLGHTSDKAVQEATQILERSLSPEIYGSSRIEGAEARKPQPWGRVTTRASLAGIPESDLPLTLRPTPLHAHDIDSRILLNIRKVLAQLAIARQWELTDWSYKMNCRCGPMQIRLVQGVDGQKYAEIVYSGTGESVLIERAPQLIPSTLERLMRNNPSTETSP